MSGQEGRGVDRFVDQRTSDMRTGERWRLRMLS